MTPWQRRVRLGIAVFGIASAIGIFLAFRERQVVQPPAAVARLDPEAVLESQEGDLARFRGEKQDFAIKVRKQFTYADGSTRFEGVEITATNRGGRDFVISASEGRSGQNEKEMVLSGGVTLVASDGFELTTGRATFSETSGLAQTEGVVEFKKGRMSGSGSAVSYGQQSDVLTIGERAEILVVDDAGGTALDFSAASAVLDRAQDLLTLDGMAHVQRGEQGMEADRVTARLSAQEEFVTFIELRGNASVADGQGSLEAMSARDIDLDYTDDGQTLERVVLNGESAVALRPTAGSGGRQFASDMLDLLLAPDGTPTRVIGRDNAQLTLAATADAPSRRIRSQTLDATGEAGAGLSFARFGGAVDYREDAVRAASSREVRSQNLELSLAGDAVSGATFTGAVVFEEQDFRAQAARAEYLPTSGSLTLSGTDAGGGPCVADDAIGVEAGTIGVTIETRRLDARGNVRTTLRPRDATGAGGASACAVARQRTAATTQARRRDTDTRLPGIFVQDQMASVTADTLDYQGSGKPLTFSGNASLVQGETVIRATRIFIDQEQGNLLASGNAVLRTNGSSDTLKAGSTPSDMVQATADEIRYTDARRLIEYTSPPPSPARGSTPAGAATEARGRAASAGAAAPRGSASAPAPSPARRPAPVRLKSADYDLRAQRIEAFLAAEGSRAERIEAYTGVTAVIGTRQASGNRLTYHATDDRYEMQGTSAAAVRVVDACRQITGRSLTFFGATDRIVVDGQEQRTQARSGGACASTPTP